MRATAWGVVAAAVAVPLVRRRLRIAPVVAAATTAAAPVAICVAMPRSRTRDVATCALQMWAYVLVYQMPYDDPDALRRRVHVTYPVKLDRALGLGRLPTLRLQDALAKTGAIRSGDKLLVWAHWLWFLVPHGTVAYLLLRRPQQFARGATLTYAVFDVGVTGYWLVPTAPPWYAAELGQIGGDGPAVRRMMAEHGEQFWKAAWRPLYDFLGGNPLAAMPSLHFATSVMAAHLLTDAGPLQGVAGWTYAVTLGFALVYLGEHYLVDLLAGLALAEGVRRAERPLAPLAQGFAGAIRRLELRAAR
jgi:membrane-associated phospholipid phosphatase